MKTQGLDSGNTNGNSRNKTDGMGI